MVQTSTTMEKEAAPSKGGRTLKLTAERLGQMRTIALDHPQATVEELRQTLQEETGVQASSMTSYRVLPRIALKRQRRQQWPVPQASPQPAAAPRYSYTERHRNDGDASR
jgi:transposase